MTILNGIVTFLALYLLEKNLTPEQLRNFFLLNLFISYGAIFELGLGRVAIAEFNIRKNTQVLNVFFHMLVLFVTVLASVIAVVIPDFIEKHEFILLIFGASMAINRLIYEAQSRQIQYQLIVYGSIIFSHITAVIASLRFPELTEVVFSVTYIIPVILFIFKSLQNLPNAAAYKIILQQNFHTSVKQPAYSFSSILNSMTFPFFRTTLSTVLTPNVFNLFELVTRFASLMLVICQNLSFGLLGKYYTLETHHRIRIAKYSVKFNFGVLFIISITIILFLDEFLKNFWSYNLEYTTELKFYLIIFVSSFIFEPYQKLLIASKADYNLVITRTKIFLFSNIAIALIYYGVVNFGTYAIYIFPIQILLISLATVYLFWKTTDDYDNN